MKTIMQKTNRIFKNSLLVLLALPLAFASCSKEDAVTTKKEFQMEATDAPIDDANVEAVFVTVSEIYVDGQKLEGFQKTTMELSALVNGNTKILGSTSLEANSVSNVELVFDYETDADGNAPGCYVVKAGAVKDKIDSDIDRIAFEVNATLDAESRTELVLDFDLRKLIKKTGEDYDLVTAAEIKAHTRKVIKASASHVRGTIDHGGNASEKAIAYLYKKGEFNATTELSGQGESSIQFANAVNSSEVDGSGNFSLSFIEEGNYEIHVFEYEDSDMNGEFELTGKAEISSMNSLSLNNISVTSESDVDLEIEVTAILPL